MRQYLGILCVLGVLGASVAQSHPPISSKFEEPEKRFREPANNVCRRLERHLGLTSTGCVDFRSAPKKGRITVAPRLLENGVAKHKLPSWNVASIGLEGLSVSVKRAPGGGRDHDMVIAIHAEKNQSSPSFTSSFARPATKAEVTVTRTLAKELTLKPSEPTAIWVLAGGECSEVVDEWESIEEMAKRYEWAAVLTITLE